MPTLKLLAFCPKLDPATKDACGWDRNMIRRDGQPAVREARYPYFHDGYIDIGLPRDVAYTTDITKAAKGYGVADEQGNLLGKFDSLPAAESALAGAKIRLVTDIALPEEEEKVADTAK